MTFIKKTTISLLGAVLLSACQSVPPSPNTHLSADVLPTETISFGITGKIGVSGQDVEGKKQAGSAFYSWGQQDDRFTIELTGALGLGLTTISYDGRVAKLSSERTGDVVADTPEALLARATGWQAPISQLPYWIMGRVAPDDRDSVFDEGRLSVSTNSDWTANFGYAKNDSRPNRLTINHIDGHKVVMTIVYPE